MTHFPCSKGTDQVLAQVCVVSSNTALGHYIDSVLVALLIAAVD